MRKNAALCGHSFFGLNLPLGWNPFDLFTPFAVAAAFFGDAPGGDPRGNAHENQPEHHVARLRKDALKEALEVIHGESDKNADRNRAKIASVVIDRVAEVPIQENAGQQNIGDEALVPGLSQMQPPETFDNAFLVV